MQNDNLNGVVINRLPLFTKDEYLGKDIIEVFHWFIQSFKSENTQQSYSRDLEEFFLFSYKFLKIKIVTLKQITERLVILWKESLSSFSLSSVARKLSSLSSFLTFTKKRGLIELNVLELIKKPKIDKRGKTNTLNQEEVLKLLEFAKKQFQISKSKQSRSYCVWRLRYTVMYTLFTVGMRAEELCELKINSLENVGQFWRLHMITKGNVTHSPIIHPNTAQVLLEYKNEFRSEANMQDYFFIRTQMSKNLTKLNRVSVFDMIKVSVKESCIFKEISPHSFRATLATLLHQQGIPIVQIQNLLNHKLVSTTSIYIKKSVELSDSATQKIEFLE